MKWFYIDFFYMGGYGSQYSLNMLILIYYMNAIYDWLADNLTESTPYNSNHWPFNLEVFMVS